MFFKINCDRNLELADQFKFEATQNNEMQLLIDHQNKIM